MEQKLNLPIIEHPYQKLFVGYSSMKLSEWNKVELRRKYSDVHHRKKGSIFIGWDGAANQNRTRNCIQFWDWTNFFNKSSFYGKKWKKKTCGKNKKITFVLLESWLVVQKILTNARIMITEWLICTNELFCWWCVSLLAYRLDFLILTIFSW